ncbi:PAS domain-containing sensor histidine kinase [Magnetospira sp. QH-2]|uniref:hybrid sensor histidine kinase/response regulator n=1 Tax=Magnetospira sp. (strain QH-2) TaxID=1288970 RepID=UPI0003E818DF|nr:PAS domain-containing sensor histidine kinase [Magnetospira sp. QH-2]CCQ74103.1 Putative histidine kinase with PAS 4 domain and response regulator receiver domain [Magnetospira sp. QH-2]
MNVVRKDGGNGLEQNGGEEAKTYPWLEVTPEVVAKDKAPSLWPWTLGFMILGLAAAAVLLYPEPILEQAGYEPSARNTWMAAAIPGVLAFGLLARILVLVSAGPVSDPSRPSPSDLLLAAAEAEREGWGVVDPEGRILHANLAFEQLFPSSRPEDEDDPDVPMDTVAERLAADATSLAAFNRLAEGIDEGRAGETEMRVRAPGGAVEGRRLTVTPLPPESGFPGYALWRVAPVRERPAPPVELDTEDSGARALRRDLLDNLPVGVFSIGDDGRFRYVNSTMADWLGRPVRTLLEDPSGLAGYISEESLGQRSYDGEQGEGQHGEVTLQGATGDRFQIYLHQSSREAEDGNFVYSRSVALKDLVPRGSLQAKTVEASDDEEAGFAFRHLREGQRWLFLDAPVGIVLIDHGGQVLDCNRAFRRLIGLHREAVVGWPLSDRIVREDQGDMAAQLSKLVMGTMKATHFEVRMPGLNEREVSAAVYASQMVDAEGDPMGAVLHFIDTTEQKVLEQQFNQSQKMQAVGQLAGGVAHDFNNLLTAMIGFCDLLLTRHGPGDASFKDIMQIKQNANRATDLVRQLLAFSRRQTLQPRLMNINDGLSELSKMLRRLLGETIELVLEPSVAPALVRVDPGQFDQVVVNLVVNARDAMPGGGNLIIRTKTVDFDEPVARGHEIMPAGPYVVVEVVDTGTGITKEDVGRIFEPFFSTKEVGKGTGLGLSTVYGIVCQTAGFIFVDSAQGEGTSFIIYLPRFEPETEDEQQLLEAPVAGSGVPLRRRMVEVEEADLSGVGRVLLVEDEEAVRLFGARALSLKGYDVLEAADGEQALEIVQGLDEPLDMIISDVVMPGMDGQTLIKLVRHEMPSVKTILISGYAEDAIPEEIGRDPSIHFLPKPFSLKQLAAKVKDVMEGPAAD